MNNEIQLFSEKFILEMAYKMTDAKDVQIENIPPTVIIRINCENKELMNIFSQWVGEITPLGPIVTEEQLMVFFDRLGLLD